jgi:hypothetical protein
MSRTPPEDDPQVVEALSDLSWKGHGPGPVFGRTAVPAAAAAVAAPAAAVAGAAPAPATAEHARHRLEAGARHCLEAGTPRGQFILAPKTVGEGPCSFEFRTAGSPGFEFQEFLVK